MNGIQKNFSILKKTTEKIKMQEIWNENIKNKFSNIIIKKKFVELTEKKTKKKKIKN